MAKNCYKFPNTVISVQIFHWKQVNIIVWVNSNIAVQCWHFKMWYFLLLFLYYKFIKCQKCNKNRQNVFSTTNYFAIVQRINVIFSYKWLLIFKVKHVLLRSKSNDWLAQNQNNVSEWSYMSIHGLLFQWANTI